jgi:hypothetical protein
MAMAEKSLDWWKKMPRGLDIGVPPTNCAGEVGDNKSQRSQPEKNHRDS